MGVPDVRDPLLQRWWQAWWASLASCSQLATVQRALNACGWDSEQSQEMLCWFLLDGLVQAMITVCGRDCLIRYSCTHSAASSCASEFIMAPADTKPAIHFHG